MQLRAHGSADFICMADWRWFRGLCDALLPIEPTQTANAHINAVPRCRVGLLQRSAW